MDWKSALVRQGVILLLTVTVGSMGAVMLMHYRAWRAAPRADSLAPLHVFLVSLAQMCFLLGAAISVLGDPENPFTYKMYLYVAGCVLTLISLYIIGYFQRIRIATAARGKDPDGDEHRTVE